MTCKTTYRLAAIITAGMLMLTGCSSDNDPISFTGYAMGTVVSETLYTDSDDISTEIERAIASVENTYLSRKIDKSEISKINSKASLSPVEMTDTLSEYMDTLLEVSRDSGGAFDPSVGALSALWDFDNDSEIIPSEDDISKCLSYGSYKDIQLSGSSISLPPGLKLDLGAAGKGIALDTAESILSSDKNVSGAVISVGESSILTYGRKPDGSDWQIAIRDPRDKESTIGTLILSGTNCIGTSGDYQKYFEKNGRRYHHILDPSTGYPAESGVISVTVICNSGIICDALSTACFVLGADEGMKLAEKYGAEAIFVKDDQSIVMTKGAEKLWQSAS